MGAVQVSEELRHIEVSIVLQLQASYYSDSSFAANRRDGVWADFNTDMHSFHTILRNRCKNVLPVPVTRDSQGSFPLLWVNLRQ